MAITLLQENKLEECFGNIFSESYNKNHCSNCHNGIKNCLCMPYSKKFIKKHHVDPESCSQNLIDAVTREKLIKNDKDQENDTDQE